MWSDLKDRRIIQILLSYAAFGWVVLLEGVGLLIEMEVLPPVLFQLALVVYVAGLPASLVLGWYHGERGSQKVTRTELALLGVIAMGALTAGYAVLQQYRAEALAEAAGGLDAELDARRVAVLYFEDRSADGRFQHVADGFTEDLIRSLDQVEALNVVSRFGVEEYRDADVATDSVAHLLEAGTVVRGSVEPVTAEGERLRVSVRIIDGWSGSEFRRQSRTWATDSLLAARVELADEVARLLREWLGEEIQLRRTRQEAESSAAWALVQRAGRSAKEARDAFGDEEVDRARALYLQADSLLAQAEEIDPSWSEPPIERGWIAYALARSGLASERQELERWMEAGLAHAARALRKTARDPEALELRGTLRYEQYLRHVGPEGSDRARLLESAREDLETAVDLRPGLASGYATLSSLYYQTGDFPAAVLAARQAYQRDYYLRSAGQVLWRLFNASYDLEDYNGARQWCEEGGRRFPEAVAFQECQLWLMTMAAAEPDVERAWELYEGLEEAHGRTQRARLARTLAVVGGVIGRSALRSPDGTPLRQTALDSADNVLRAARTGPEVDPERNWLWYEAVMRTLMDEHEEAVRLLERYTAANPGHFGRGAALHWWWEDLEGRPAFERIRELQSEGH